MQSGATRSAPEHVRRFCQPIGLDFRDRYRVSDVFAATLAFMCAMLMVVCSSLAGTASGPPD